MARSQASFVWIIARCLVSCGLAVGLSALCQQPLSRSDQPEQPGRCINNLLTSDCNLAQTDLVGPVHTVEIWMDRDSPPVFHSGHEIREYSPGGLLIEGGSVEEGRIVWRTKYVYDAEGHRIETDSVDEAGVPRAPRHTTEMRVYDTNGRLLSRDSRDDTSSMVFHDEWSYSTAGLLITADSTSLLHVDPSAQHYGDEHTDYRYDADGRLIEMKAMNSRGFISGDLRYEYPAPGEKRTLNFTSWCQADDVPPSKPKVTIDDRYDAAGHLLNEVVTAANYPSGCKTPLEFGRTQYVYDSAGRVVQQSHYSPAGRLISRATMAYDSHGNRATMSATEESPNRKPTQSVSRSEYIYDSHGNWTRLTEGSSGTRYRVLTYY